MKKIISLLMALAMCLSLCACGGGDTTTESSTPNATENTEPKNPEPSALYNIGDTVSTDIAEFTLTEMETGWYSALNTLWSGGYIEKELISEETTKDALPDEAQQVLDQWVKDGDVNVNKIVFNFTIKNIGKETLNNFVTFGDNQTREISGLLRLNYNDGFIFECESCYETTDGLRASPYLDIEPLSPASSYFATIEFPEEVSTNTEAPLLLEVALPNANEETEIFTFSIR